LKKIKSNELFFTIILLVGLIVRIILAPFSSGSDIVQFAGFAKTIQRHGFCFYNYAAAFSEEMWPYNWPYLYGPILAYILGLLVHVVNPDYSAFWVNGHYFVYVSEMWILVLKSVFIVFDMLVALLIYIITRRILLVVLYYLNPAVIYTSSIYGMFDQIALALLLTGLILLEKKRPGVAGVLIALSLLTKQNTLFSILGLAILLTQHRDLFKNTLMGFIVGTLLTLSPILVTCPTSLLKLKDTLYMLRPNYVEPLAYSFNGLSSLATLIHRVYGINTLWLIEYWYIFTLILLPLLILYTLRRQDIYLNTLLYYLLFTTTYWRVNYQYLTLLIGLLAVGVAREVRKSLKGLYILLALYIGAWFFIFPVDWWFRVHIEKPNNMIIKVVKAFSINIYIDEYYAFYSLILTLLEYTTILYTSLIGIKDLKIRLHELFKYS